MLADSPVSEDAVRALLECIPDPEIPVLTITDLGIVRWVRIDDGTVTVGLAPTYTGCPATEVIAASVLAQLRGHGYADARVEQVLSPPWTTDWISESGREKLLQYGIVPPARGASKQSLLRGERPLACPRCRSTTTTRVSEFGSTPCKASYKCAECLEPFEYFKCI